MEAAESFVNAIFTVIGWIFKLIFVWIPRGIWNVAIYIAVGIGLIKDRKDSKDDE